MQLCMKSFLVDNKRLGSLVLVECTVTAAGQIVNASIFYIILKQIDFS